MGIDIFFIGDARLVAIVKFKRHMVNVYIFGIIINKFSYCKECRQIILLVINKNFKIGLYCIVLVLGLAINLRVKSSKEFSLNFQDIT